jgi:D-arabinose 1-dehydrogenase-like Zn-dependent alcohol dehydrogenase
VPGIQYAKAKGLRVIAIDISEAQLQNAADLGADLTFNSMTDTKYAPKLKEATKGGAHAAIVFSAAQRAYADAPKVLRYVILDI